MADTEKEKIAGTKSEDEDKCDAKKGEPEEKPKDDVNKAETGEEGDKEEEEKKKAKKGEGGGESPEEGAEAGAEATNTVTPGDMTGAKQDVMVPPSSVNVPETQTFPADKSADATAMKSPVYVALKKDYDALKQELAVATKDMREATAKKLDAVEKSVADRLANIQKAVDKFYSQSFYKAAGESVGPEGTQQLPIEKQLENGKARFSK